MWIYIYILDSRGKYCNDFEARECLIYSGKPKLVSETRLERTREAAAGNEFREVREQKK